MSHPTAHTTTHQAEAVHACAYCGQVTRVTLHEFVAGADVLEGRVVWLCDRHRKTPASGFQWVDLPAAPHVGD